MKLRYFWGILGVILIAISGSAQTVEPDRLPNPNVNDYREYVADPAGLLDSGTRARVNRRLAALRDSTSAEVAVAIVPSIGDYDVADYAERVFTSWGLGKKDRDNGLLLLISPESRVARIQTGYGMEGVVPDAVAATVIREDVVPAMREGDLSLAVEDATTSLSRIISDPEYAEELRSKLADNRGGEMTTLDDGVVRSFAYWVAALMWIIGAVVFVRVWLRARGQKPGARAALWRDSRMKLWILAFLSLGLGVIFPLIAMWKYRRARFGIRRCAKCGGRMAKVSQPRDQEWLTPAQQLERRLGSVDYDVWRCPQDGEVEIDRYPREQSRYFSCPNCGNVTMHQVGRRTIIPATTRQSGVGEKIYKCEYCGHNHTKRYTIPRLVDRAALAIGAAAALGASRSRGGGFGGGGFGGGFGGGSTGGGGASGSW